VRTTTVGVWTTLNPLCHCGGVIRRRVVDDQRAQIVDRRPKDAVDAGR
jgi:hypothetical protein